MVELETVSRVLTAGLTKVATSLGRQARMIFLIGAGLAELVSPRGNRGRMRRRLELGVTDWPAARPWNISRYEMASLIDHTQLGLKRGS